jgi:hypothetical protein
MAGRRTRDRESRLARDVDFANAWQSFTDLHPWAVFRVAKGGPQVAFSKQSQSFSLF